MAKPKADNTRRIVKRRLTLLRLAEELANVSAACRRLGFSRSQYYELLRRYTQSGCDGLLPRPHSHRSHPLSTPPCVCDEIVALALEHPLWGCERISKSLARNAIVISSPTVQHVLIRRGFALRSDRIAELERRAVVDSIPLTEEQSDAIERANPCFRERARHTARPGEILTHGTFSLMHLPGVGRVKVTAIVDTYCSLVFGTVHTRDHQRPLTDLFEKVVLPHYRRSGLGIATVESSAAIAPSDLHNLQDLLISLGIGHVRRGLTGLTNGYIERFRREVETEFLPRVSTHSANSTPETIEREFRGWLRYYNRKRPNPGYRNMGKRPIEAFLGYRDHS